MNATWVVERTTSPRFPYGVSVEQSGRVILAVRAQARWPGPGQQIFCLREGELTPPSRWSRSSEYPSPT